MIALVFGSEGERALKGHKMIYALPFVRIYRL